MVRLYKKRGSKKTRYDKGRAQIGKSYADSHDNANENHHSRRPSSVVHSSVHRPNHLPSEVSCHQSRALLHYAASAVFTEYTN